MLKGLIKVEDWRHIREGWEFDKDQTYPFAPKLTLKYVEVDRLSTMKVKLQVQVVRRSVASLLCYMNASGNLSSNNTTNFSALMDDLFDSVNGSMFKHDYKPLLSAVSKTLSYLKSWENFTDF